ncbi:4-hydroxyphenylpyruvate dioxygenase [Kitasatospora sp. NPDC006697]|uniref:4-hydroxyphenylpyruvate dioxygenase n=1 Tax=Kitasatospora sp. NPDC006697 TaxID=3364020 RepID=UPI00369835FE
MSAQGIEYVELYAGDQNSAVELLEGEFGFTRIARTETADMDSVLLRQGGVQILVTSGPGTWKFLEEHGDGIADIALGCEDVAATLESAAAAGASVTRSWRGDPVVSGFGDVTHTLLPLSTSAAAPLPAGPGWTALGDAEQRPAGPIRQLDHIAVCIDGGTLEQVADYYRDGFGLSRYSSEYLAVGDQAMDSIVVRSAFGHVTFTLVAPDPAKGAGQLDSFLLRNSGPGVQHLAFLVDEIIPTVHDFRARGVEFLNTPDSYYDLLAERFGDLGTEIAQLRETQVLADRDEWGYLLQLFTRSPYERSTLFYELIQRKGSRGFGSANIRALYEAVERDRVTAAE